VQKEKSELNYSEKWNEMKWNGMKYSI